MLIGPLWTSFIENWTVIRDLELQLMKSTSLYSLHTVDRQTFICWCHYSIVCFLLRLSGSDRGCISCHRNSLRGIISLSWITGNANLRSKSQHTLHEHLLTRNREGKEGGKSQLPTPLNGTQTAPSSELGYGWMDSPRLVHGQFHNNHNLCTRVLWS